LTWLIFFGGGLRVNFAQNPHPLESQNNPNGLFRLSPQIVDL
jgi:hypothetical protein